MLTYPGAAMSVGGTLIDSWVALTNVVSRFAPFQRTVIVLVKLVPLTNRVKPAPPAVRYVGTNEVIVGAPRIVNGEAADWTPSGVRIVILTVPGDATNDCGTFIVRTPALGELVDWLAPFHRTIDPDGIFVPVTVNVNAAWPAVTEAGFRFVITGAGLMTKFRVLAEATPSAVRTPTGTVPAVMTRLVGMDAVATRNPQ